MLWWFVVVAMGIWTRSEDWRVEDSVNKDNITVVLSAYRSFLSPVAYVSMPITTGRLCYEVLEKRNVKSIEELAKTDKDAVFRDIIAPNIGQGIVFAQGVQKRTDLPVIAPAVFEAKKQRWGQNDYMFLWLNFIQERAAEMHMLDGWAYSNGGCEEFVRAMEMQFGFVEVLNQCTAEEEERIRNMKVLDAGSCEIRFNDGFNRIYDAIVDLDSRGFRSGILCESVGKLMSISGFFIDSFTSRQEHEYHLKYPVDFGVVGKKFRAIAHLCAAEKSPYSHWLHKNYRGELSGASGQKI